MPAKEFTNQLIVAVEGKPLPADVAVLLVHSIVDDSRVLPARFELRFRASDHAVMDTTFSKLSAAIPLSVASHDNHTPEPLLPA